MVSKVMGGGWGISSGVGGQYAFSLRRTSSAASVLVIEASQAARAVTVMDLCQRRQEIFSSRWPSLRDSLHFVKTEFRGETDKNL